MSAVGVKELKNRLTHYLRRTKAGEEVIVTERGKPIALLQPISPPRTFRSLETDSPNWRPKASSPRRNGNR